MTSQIVQIPADEQQIEGLLQLSASAQGIVLFAHGSGSSRHSPRNMFAAQVLQQHDIGTLLLDLLTLTENLDYLSRFDIDLLTLRLLAATRWVRQHTPKSRPLPIGLFGASTGAAAALHAAAALGQDIRAVVSRGGRPDLAGSDELAKVTAPTLLLVGDRDEEVLELNREAYDLLACDKKLCVIPGASHLFEEPGTLDQAAQLAADWFRQHLTP